MVAPGRGDNGGERRSETLKAAVSREHKRLFRRAALRRRLTESDLLRELIAMIVRDEADLDAGATPV